MSTSVFCLVKTPSQAQVILEDLQDSGYPLSDISILYPDPASRRDVGHVVATKAPEGVATGATTGGVAGGVLGLLAGIGALAIPGLGAFVAAGPLMAALSGAAAGATAGGVVGGLIGLGLPEIEAKHYESKLRTGNYLISVHADDKDQLERAERIFKNRGGEDIVKTSESAVPTS